MIDWKQKISALRIAEVLAAAALLLWRIWEIPLVTLWRDWVTILTAYWMFLIAVQDPRVRLRGTVVATTGLMLLYACGQVPHLLAQFGGSG